VIAGLNSEAEWIVTGDGHVARLVQSANQKLSGNHAPTGYTIELLERTTAAIQNSFIVWSQRAS
jgi:hypothetical protein